MSSRKWATCVCHESIVVGGVPRKALVSEMDRYRWNISGLCEMRWKNFGETTTEEGHKVFFSGKQDKNELGVGFLAHKDIVNTVMGCRTVSSRLITIRLRAVPFNIIMSLIRHRRRTFSLYKETAMQKWAGMLVEAGKAFVDPSTMTTQMRED